MPRTRGVIFQRQPGTNALQGAGCSMPAASMSCNAEQQGMAAPGTRARHRHTRMGGTKDTEDTTAYSHTLQGIHTAAQQQASRQERSRLQARLLLRTLSLQAQQERMMQ